ncbi:MAG TPA: amidohydrolase family protein [Acidimicrobiia bacterium]|nr:amidohydrolase family protein [Acidimicrobiia bacterium]
MESVIDLHVHYYTDRYVDAILSADSITTYRRQDGRLVAKWRSGVALTVVDPHPGPAERVEMMDQLGIDTQVLSVPSPSAYFVDPEPGERLARETNEELAEICRQHPGRFESVAMLPLQDVGRAMEVLDWSVDELGMKGTMILSNVDGMPLDDVTLEPFWELADARETLVYVHPTVPDAPHHDENALAIAVGFFSESTLAVARLAYSGVFERYPRIRWVFSHLGGTLPVILPRLDSYWRQFEECRELAPKPPSEYVRDLVFDTASKHGPAIQCAIDTLGEDRLVFGSDYPHVPGGTAPYLEALEPFEFSPQQRSQILSGRAATLLSGGRF